MTIYEQIQKSVDFIENRIARGVILRDEGDTTRALAAAEAGMSDRSFVTWFWAVTGVTFRDYARRRRLERARTLIDTEVSTLLEIALDTGYRSHEAFTRAFIEEFGVAPTDYRKGRPFRPGLERIALIKEMYMGIIKKEIPDVVVAYFDGFSPDSETKAHQALDEWLAAHPTEGRPRRIFGYNIDRKGNLSFDPDNEGYRLLATLEPGESAGDAPVTTIRGGKFLVTGIEGSFEEDPSGRWIMEGWKRMNQLIAEKHVRPARAPRWFEEELEPSKPGHLRLDLYIEIGE